MNVRNLLKHAMAAFAAIAMIACRDEPKPRTVRGVPPELVHFKGGAFRGSPLDCGPVMGLSVRTLEVSSFYIDRTTVTCTAYADCVDAGKCRPLKHEQWDSDGPMCAEGVAIVRWSDADDYCGFVGGAVPTSVQWQRAIRGKDAMVRAVADSGDEGDPCTHPTSVKDTHMRCRHVSPDGVEFVIDSRYMEQLSETSCPNKAVPGSRTRVYAQLAGLLSTFQVEDYARHAMFRCAYEVPKGAQL